MTRSGGELAFETFCMAYGVAMPEAEYRFCPGRRFRFDFAWPARRVAVEIDGGQWQAHGGRHATDADREKLNLAAVQGWRVLRFSPQMLRDAPSECMAAVKACLGEM